MCFYCWCLQGLGDALLLCCMVAAFPQHSQTISPLLCFNRPACSNPLQYPGDVGVLAAWFLNYLRLQPGQAVALPANEPHAYISGEIVEVMATSGEERGWGVGGGACWRQGQPRLLGVGAADCLVGAA